MGLENAIHKQGCEENRVAKQMTFKTYFSHIIMILFTKRKYNYNTAIETVKALIKWLYTV